MRSKANKIQLIAILTLTLPNLYGSSRSRETPKGIDQTLDDQLLEAVDRIIHSMDLSLGVVRTQHLKNLASKTIKR